MELEHVETVQYYKLRPFEPWNMCRRLDHRGLTLDADSTLASTLDSFDSTLDSTDSTLDHFDSTLDF